MKYGLIGKSLPHSYSKVIHGLMGNNEYELLELEPEDVGGFLANADFKGINVTIPYKEAVMPYCVPDDTAKQIGCVNTIVRRDGILYGCNTDYYGFAYMARRAGVSFAGQKALVLGSGGTSKTAARAAVRGGAAEIVIVSRNGENNYENLSAHSDCGVLINTTPVGMFPNNGQAPVSLQCFTELSAVIDVIYNPLRTKLLLEAEERGLTAASGLAMLAAQALRAHNLFFGIETSECDDDIKIAEILSEAEKRFSNIVLIGMPGCGKTTVGKALSDRLGIAFADTDHIIEKQTGRKIPDIIRSDGEPRFRELERKVIAQTAAKTNQVIATGGGCVLAKENRDALLQNGVIIFLERELEKLAVSERPLSADLHAMYKRRLPLYEGLCHYKIEVAGSPQDVLQKIIACTGR